MAKATTHCSSSGGILGSTTSHIGYLVILDELIITIDASDESMLNYYESSHRQVLILSQDRVVCIETILLEKLLSIADLDIE